MGEDKGEEVPPPQTIILAIEEPELYIHPQMQRLLFGVLRDFASIDQVLFTTHSPAFVDIAQYQSIGLVGKNTLEEGTFVCQCELGVLEQETERKSFKFVSSFGIDKNEMFFAKNIILVEGIEDYIALMATARDMNIFRGFPEEIGYTIVRVANKEEMPKYMKLLNAFGRPYTVLHELDGEPESRTNKNILSQLEDNKRIEIPNNLEALVGLEKKFPDSYGAKKFFEDPGNITDGLKDVVRQLFG